MTWRWLSNRLYGLLTRDTHTAKLYEADHAHGGPRRPSLTPDQVGDWFAARVEK